MNVSPHGSGHVTIDGKMQASLPSVSVFRDGGSVELIAIPEEGYQFAGWSGDTSGVNATTTVTMDCSKEITANFAIKEYVLTIKFTGNGYVTPEAGTHTYSYGSVVVVGAVPASGWSFDSWNGGVEDITLPISKVAMNSDRTITANFTQNMYTLTLATEGGGNVTPAVGTHNYPEGTAVSITALADSGWRFDGWSGTALDHASTTTVVILDSDKTVVATFSSSFAIWWWVGGAIALAAIVWLIWYRKIGKRNDVANHPA